MQGLPGVLAAGLLCPDPEGKGGQLHGVFSPSAPSGDVRSEHWIPEVTDRAAGCPGIRCPLHLGQGGPRAPAGFLIPGSASRHQSQSPGGEVFQAPQHSAGSREQSV